MSSKAAADFASYLSAMSEEDFAETQSRYRESLREQRTQIQARAAHLALTPEGPSLALQGYVAGEMGFGSASAPEYLSLEERREWESGYQLAVYVYMEPRRPHFT